MGKLLEKTSKYCKNKKGTNCFIFPIFQLRYFSENKRNFS